MTIKKYRPYFTLPELKELSQGAKTFSLKRYLDKFISDIEAEHRVANITLTGRPAIEDKLGFTQNPDPLLTPEMLYHKYRAQSNGVGMTKEERDKALEFGYQNDLLNPQEDAEYEMKLFSKDI